MTWVHSFLKQRKEDRGNCIPNSLDATGVETFADLYQVIFIHQRGRSRRGGRGPIDAAQTFVQT